MKELETEFKHIISQVKKGKQECDCSKLLRLAKQLLRKRNIQYHDSGVFIKYQSWVLRLWNDSTFKLSEVQDISNHKIDLQL